MKKKQDKISLKKRGLSFKYAFQGIQYAITTQHNLQIHILATIVVIIAGIFIKLNFLEWSLIIFSIGLVISAEMFNTAIEYLTDLTSPEYNKKAGNVKDIAAGAVLICAITAALIGLFVFVPKIFQW